MNDAEKTPLERAFDSAAGYTPLDDLHAYVASGASLYAYREDSDWSLLDIAVEMEHFPAIELLLASGFDINRPNRQGWPAILHAIDADVDCAIQCRRPFDFTLTERLLDLGASLDIRTPDGDTPESVASRGSAANTAFQDFLLRRLSPNGRNAS
jgi:ankyrin repeat protein